MRITRIVAVVALWLAVIPRPAGDASAQPAPDPDRRQAAAELFELLSADIYAEILRHLTAEQWPAIDKQLARIEGIPKDELRAEFERIQIETLSAAMRDTPLIYARHFTTQELREISAFYRTPTGQKALKEMPKITVEFFNAFAPRLDGVQMRIMNAFNRLMRERGYVKE